MSLSNIRNLAYNILKKLGDDTVKDKEFTELAKCPECDKDVLSPDFEAFTVLSCGHIFHRECIEKTLLLTRQSYCPVADCTTFLKPVLSERSFSVSSQSSSPSIASRMSSQLQLNSPIIQEEERRRGLGANEEEVEVQPDENSNKKRTNEATNSSPSKKAKQVKNEESPALKKLIRELCVGSPKVSEVRKKESLLKRSQQEGNRGEGDEDSTRTFLTLYVKIVNAEDEQEVSNQEVIRAYYFFGEALSRRLDHHKKNMEEHEAQMQVNDEVRDQLSKEITKTTLWKKTEQARKIYYLFRRIGSDKIQRVRSYSVSSLAKLSWDKIDYVVSQISA